MPSCEDKPDVTATGNQSNSFDGDSNRVHAHDSQAKVDWLLCIYTVADINNRSTLLKAWMPAVDSVVKEWPKYHVEAYIASYQSPSLDQTYGGFGHLRQQDGNMVALGKRIYFDLCVNFHRIGVVHILAVESGAYLAKWLIEFIIRKTVW